MTAFATLADLAARYPSELVLLAADEATGLRDDARVDLALDDASAEIRAILQARYTRAELGRLDQDSARILRVYAMDIALYRVALAFSRSSDTIRERYEATIKRLEAIAAGRGGLTFEGDPDGPDGAGAASPAVSPNVVIVEAPERIFTRDRLRRLGA